MSTLPSCTAGMRSAVVSVLNSTASVVAEDLVRDPPQDVDVEPPEVAGPRIAEAPAVRALIDAHDETVVVPKLGDRLVGGHGRRCEARGRIALRRRRRGRRGRRR